MAKVHLPRGSKPVAWLPANGVVAVYYSAEPKPVVSWVVLDGAAEVIGMVFHEGSLVSAEDSGWFEARTFRHYELADRPGVAI